MARDHARIHLDIWGDDDWLDLPGDAQLLYLTLYTSPGRTLCGAHEWNPGKLAQRAGDWTVARIEAAATILSRELFLIVDPDTNECLLRSWVKHDGLWRTPNMAVSVANARADLASRTLRGVVVHEVLKLKNAEPKSSSWERPAVQSMLTQKAIDPTDLEPFKGGPKGGSNPVVNPVVKGGSNPTVNENLTHGVNGASNGGPTNAIPNATATKRSGYVSGERYGGAEPDPNDPPLDHCREHPGGTSRPCRDCQNARESAKAWRVEQDHVEAEQRAQFLDEVAGCPDCDELGWIATGANGVVHCPRHDWTHAHV